MDKPPRRPEFEAITMGWGADGLQDLVARCQLLAVWWGKNFPASPAEHKVCRAMRERLHSLGGVTPPELLN